MRILKIDETEFYKNPTDVLSGIPDITTEQQIDLLNAVLSKPHDIDIKNFTIQGLREYTVMVVTFFLTERLKEYVRRIITSTPNTKRLEWMRTLRDKNLAALVYIELYQTLNRPITTESSDGRLKKRGRISASGH